MKLRVLLLCAAASLTAGCGIIENPSPERVRLVIEGDAGKTVRLVISTKFLAAINERDETRVEIFVADTVPITLPFSKTYSIEDDQRFFVETTRVETDLQNLNMEVFVDGRRVFGDGSSLVAGRPLRFVYMFNQQVTREIVVI